MFFDEEFDYEEVRKIAREVVQAELKKFRLELGQYLSKLLEVLEKKLLPKLIEQHVRQALKKKDIVEQIRALVREEISKLLVPA